MFAIVDTPLGGPLRPPATRDDRWLAALDDAVLPGGARARSRLDDPRALVVTSGQQPGLFTGPLYTVHKALSARAVAIALEARWRRPVVPVFWVAGDDHDFTEAASCSWLGADGSLVQVDLPPRPPDGPLTPIYREPVPAIVGELLDLMEATLPPGSARDQTVAWLRQSYRQGSTLARASGEALAEVLGELGVVCLDASSAAVKQAAMPVMHAALRQAADLDRLLVAHAARLEASGEAPQVKVGDGASLVFLEARTGRDRLVPEPGGVRTRRGGEELSWSELERIAEQEPERFSPNVLLRPVVESAVLPTVAYLAGPAERRYLELARVLYEPLGVRRQEPLARWSGMLIERRVARAAEKFGTSIEELTADSAAVESRVLRSLAPEDFEPAFATLRAALEQGYDRIGAVARQIDPTLEKPARSAKGGALVGLNELEKRLLQAQKRRQGELLGQIERARNAIHPLGKPQERVLGLPGFTGRYGFEVAPLLAKHIEGWYRAALEAPVLTT